MKKYITSAFIGIFATFSVWAQTQTHPLTGAVVDGPIPTTIREIQSISGSRLSNCDDLSSFDNLTVVFRGRVPMSGKINFPAATIGGTAFPAVNGSTTGINANGRELYLMAGNGPFSGIMVRKSTNSSTPTTPFDLLDAVAGDSLAIVGVVNSFQGMTQVDPIEISREVQAASVPNVPANIDGQPVEGIAPVTVTVAELNTGSNQVNVLETGEKWEATFVELRDLTVINVTPDPVSINNSSSSTRVRIICEDAQGNTIQIYDRFRAARLGGWGGRLQVPNVGARYRSVRGMITHSKNAPVGVSCPDINWTVQDQGYQLHPFYPTHYQLGDSPPIIRNVKIAPIAPKPTESVTVSADIISPDNGITVSGASLYYSFDTLNYDSWTNISMTRQGNTFSASIPSTGFNEGNLVYFYIKSMDSRAQPLYTLFPRVPATLPGVATLGRQKPAFFVVRENGLQLRDVQYTPFADGRSGYADREVTITGVVTADHNSSDGFMAIQQEGANEWAGILVDVAGNSNLNNIKRGWKIELVGTVSERQAGASTFTILTNLKLDVPPIPLSTTAKITPVKLNSTLLGGFYNSKVHEKYEGMLATLFSGEDNKKIFVVDTNPDFSSNFSEYRVGTDPSLLASLPVSSTPGFSRNTFIPGTRVLTGRSSNSTSINSQAVSLVNLPTLFNNTANANAPDTAVVRSKSGNVIIASTSISMDSISGIVQNSFGNMKLLPRNNSDLHGLSRSTANSTEGGLEKYFKVYPVPAFDKVFVETSLPGDKSIELVSSMGGVAYSDSFSGNHFIDLSGLSHGLYFLKISTAGGVVVKKIIKN